MRKTSPVWNSRARRNDGHRSLPQDSLNQMNSGLEITSNSNAVHKPLFRHSMKTFSSGAGQIIQKPESNKTSKNQ